MATAPDAEPVKSSVDAEIDKSGVVLFMKGTPERPQCGFSQRAAGLIAQYRDDFRTENVLDDLAAYRQALETHSGWETVPQCYVDGEFIGGSDILAELDEKGELEARLNGDTAG